MTDKEYIALLEEELSKQQSYSHFHKMSYDLVENIIADATKDIASNFEGNLKVLKSLCHVLKSSDLDENVVSSLRQATDSMHEYITILQCEDRIFQILNGISAATDMSMANIEKIQGVLDEDKMLEYGQQLIPHYTVQEQRDIASGDDMLAEEEMKRAAGTIELF